jgi:pimeloyl-ACP methyl ester carboxylesterase
MSIETDYGRQLSVVLVHGLWSGPYDWRWVTPLLERADARVLAVDLPSHSSPDAGVREDGDAVRAAIRDCDPPIVVAAWSAGDASMEFGADGEVGVARLVYVACSPSAPQGEKPEPSEWIDGDPLIRRLGDGTFVLDTDLWLEAESHLFDAEVLAHLKEHPRRPVSLRAVTDANPGQAWATIPFTVLLGRSDLLVPVEETVQEIANLLADKVPDQADVRIIDSDHFIPFRQPDAVADVILEPLP